MTDLQCAARLLVIRHAEAEYESDVWSDAGGSLSTSGRAQVAALAERLSTENVSWVWSSTMARAVQTAEILAARCGVGVTTREGLREFRVGDLVGRPMSTDVFAQDFAAWLDGDLERRIPGAESGSEVVARFAAVVAEVADQHRGETVAVISHGGITRLGVPHVARMGAGVAPGRTPNTGVIEVHIDADGAVCTAWQTVEEGSP